MPTALDLTLLREAFGDDAQGLREMVDLGVTSIRSLIATIAAERETSTRAAMAERVHELKGVCANIGAEATSALCVELEGVLRTKPDEDVGPLLARLREEGNALAGVAERAIAGG